MTARAAVPRAPAPPRPLTIRSVQKLSGTLASTAYAAGSTIKTVTMPAIAAADPANTHVENVWWRRTAGTLTALIQVFADVTGPNQITVVINSPVAQTLTLEIGGRVVEYG